MVFRILGIWSLFKTKFVIPIGKSSERALSVEKNHGNMKVQKKKHLAYARKLRHTKIATLSPQMSNDFFVSPKFKTKKLYALAKDSDACDVFLSFAYGFYAYGYFEQKSTFTFY